MAQENEVAAMVAICKGGQFTVHVLEDMHVVLTRIFELLTDSQSGRDSVVNLGATKNTVHYERWLHYARDLYLRKMMMITFVPTERMRADDKTKVVHKAKLLFCRMMQMNLFEG